MEFTYKSNARGYQIYYKNEWVFGAGILNDVKLHWRHARANIKYFAEQAKATIEQYQQGRIPESVKAKIAEIDSK